MILRHSGISRSISFEIFVPIFCVHKTLLCGVAASLKVINYFTSLLNPQVNFAIGFDLEILRVVLSRSNLIMHAKNYSSKNIDLVIYYLFVYSIISINDCLSPVVSISCMYKITISVPSLFTLYKIQVSVFRCFNTALRFIVFMYYFKQQCTACKRP